MVRDENCNMAQSTALDTCSSQDKTEQVLYNNTSESLYQTGHIFSTYQVIKVLVLLSLFLLTERSSGLPAGTYIIKVTEWQTSKTHVPTGSISRAITTDLPHNPCPTKGAGGL